MTAIQNELGEILAERGLKQSDLAAMVGVMPCHINRIKRRHIVPSLSTALKISRALGVPLEEVFDLEAGPES